MKIDQTGTEAYTVDFDAADPENQDAQVLILERMLRKGLRTLYGHGPHATKEWMGKWVTELLFNKEGQ